jgi:hypothetical protein
MGKKLTEPNNDLGTEFSVEKAKKTRLTFQSFLGLPQIDMLLHNDKSLFYQFIR